MEKANKEHRQQEYAHVLILYDTLREHEYMEENENARAKEAEYVSVVFFQCTRYLEWYEVVHGRARYEHYESQLEGPHGIAAYTMNYQSDANGKVHELAVEQGWVLLLIDDAA